MGKERHYLYLKHYSGVLFREFRKTPKNLITDYRLPEHRTGVTLGEISKGGRRKRGRRRAE
jgi:hypothetical protein